MFSIFIVADRWILTAVRPNTLMMFYEFGESDYDVVNAEKPLHLPSAELIRVIQRANKHCNSFIVTLPVI